MGAAGTRWLALAGVGALLFAVTAEVGARVAGLSPYAPPVLDMDFDPPGWALPDDRLGIVLGPGRFAGRVGAHRWTATHDDEGWRVVPGASPGVAPSVLVLGDSFSYGFGVDDHQTLAARLQADWPDEVVAVRAVPGWGLAQVWLVVDDAIASAPPPLMVLGFAAFLDERTVLLRHWKRSLAPFHDSHDLAQGRWPALAVVQGQPQVRWDGMAYASWPLSGHSAVVAGLEQLVLEQEDRAAHPHDVAVDVLVALSARVTEAGSRLVVVGLDDDPLTADVLGRAAALGVWAIHTGVPRTGSWTLLPDDPHPSAQAVARWAAAVEREVEGRRSYRTEH